MVLTVICPHGSRCQGSVCWKSGENWGSPLSGGDTFQGRPQAAGKKGGRFRKYVEARYSHKRFAGWIRTAALLVHRPVNLLFDRQYQWVAEVGHPRLQQIATQAFVCGQPRPASVQDWSYPRHPLQPCQRSEAAGCSQQERESGFGGDKTGSQPLYWTAEGNRGPLQVKCFFLSHFYQFCHLLFVEVRAASQHWRWTCRRAAICSRCHFFFQARCLYFSSPQAHCSYFSSHTSCQYGWQPLVVSGCKGGDSFQHDRGSLLRLPGDTSLCLHRVIILTLSVPRFSITCQTKHCSGSSWPARGETAQIGWAVKEPIYDQQGWSNIQKLWPILFKIRTRIYHDFFALSIGNPRLQQPAAHV